MNYRNRVLIVLAIAFVANLSSNFANAQTAKPPRLRHFSDMNQTDLVPLNSRRRTNVPQRKQPVATSQNYLVATKANSAKILNPKRPASVGASTELELSSSANSTPLKSLGSNEGSLQLPKKGEKKENSSRAFGTKSPQHVIMSLALIIGGFLVIAMLLRSKESKNSKGEPIIQVLHKTSLGPRQQLQMVLWGQRLLLIAVSSSKVETLAEVSEPAEVHRLLTSCDASDSATLDSVFQNLLSRNSETVENPSSSRSRRKTFHA